MVPQVEVLFFRARERDKSWVYCCAMVLVGTTLNCKGKGTYKIRASLCRRSRNSPVCTPKMTNEVANAVRNATRLMPSIFWAEPAVSSLGITLAGLLVVVVSTLDDVELLDSDAKLADDVIVDAKVEDIVDITDPDMDAVDTAVVTVVGSVEGTVEEAMMASETW